jgi:hypothetical protein
MADGSGRWQMADGSGRGHLSGITDRLLTLTIKTDNTALHLETVATEVEPRAPLVSYSGYCSVPYRASGEP